MIPNQQFFPKDISVEKAISSINFFLTVIKFQLKSIKPETLKRCVLKLLKK
jgi:hypothetical protein